MWSNWIEEKEKEKENFFFGSLLCLRLGYGSCCIEREKGRLF